MSSGGRAASSDTPESQPSISEAMRNMTLIESPKMPFSDSGESNLMYSSSHASSVSLNDFSGSFVSPSAPPIDRQPSSSIPSSSVLLQITRSQTQPIAIVQSLPSAEKKEFNVLDEKRDLLEKENYINPYEDHHNHLLKFKSPREECSPEDCCCCFYFLYLLFNPETKPAAFESNASSSKVVSSMMMSPEKLLKVKKNTDRVLSSGGPGYSFFKNISSTRSSIDSSIKFHEPGGQSRNEGEEEDYGERDSLETSLSLQH
jgi:hypothetical protein